MVLESCMILLDNSEYMRNGDYIPTRLEAQHDAANFLVGAKTQSNPENTVGVIAMCGGTSFSGGNSNSSSSSSSPGELLVSPTDDMAKILSALHGIPIQKGCQSRNFANGDDNDTIDNIGKGGGVDLIVSLQVANLALKHRRNKNGEQRVIVFVGSPLTHVDSRALTRAGRMLKKNNLSIDVIAMGELEENEDKLKDLVDAANGPTSSASADDNAGERTCHLVTIPAGVLPSDVLVSSPIVHGGSGGMSAGSGGISAGGSGGAGATGGFSEFGGVDPNMDPELAMALRVSMEEERARQERAAAAATSAQESNNDGANNATEEDGTAAMEVDSSAAAVNATTATEDVGFEVSEDDALLQQALAMSMTNGNDTTTTSAAAPATETTTAAAAASTTNTSAPDEDMIDEEDEDAAMQLALQMSMQPDTEEGAPPAANADEGASTAASSQQFQDPQFVNQLLGTLPSGESNDAVRNILDKKKKDGDDKNDGDKK